AIGFDARTGADLAVLQHTVRADPDIPFYFYFTFQNDVDVDVNVSGHLNFAAYIEAAWVGERHTGQHQFARPGFLEATFQFGELHAIIHAGDFERIVAYPRGDFAAFLRRQRHDVCQIVFALGVVAADRRQPLAQFAHRNGHDA